MEDTDKQEILSAIAAQGTRFDNLEERLADFRTEVRERFDNVENRLDTLEEESKGISTTLDKLIEGDTLGTEHVTLTRPEYDSMVDSLHLPNRFARRAR